jgi:hypothetical protein
VTYPGTSDTLARPDHYGQIHVDFQPDPAAAACVGLATPPGALTGTTPRATGSSQAPAPSTTLVSFGLNAAEWSALVARLSQIPEPHIGSQPSPASIPDAAGAAALARPVVSSAPAGRSAAALQRDALKHVRH